MMPPDRWGGITLTGGTCHEAVAVVGDRVVMVVSRRDDHSTLVGLRIEAVRSRVHQSWMRQLPLGPRDVFRGMAVAEWPSVVSRTDGLVYVVAGSARLLIDAKDGSVIEEANAPAPPSDPATLLEKMLVVPEGRAVAAYEPSTLALLWRRPTPQSMWAGHTSADGLCWLVPAFEDQTEPWQETHFWDLYADRVHVMPRLGRIGTPVLGGSTLVIPSGGAAAERITAVNRETFETLWEEHYRPPAAGPFWAPTPLGNPLAVHRDHLLAVTDAPTLECRTLETGSLVWRVALRSQPSAFSVLNGNAWVADDGSVANTPAQLTVVDVATGVHRARLDLTYSASERIVAIVPGSGSSEPLLIGSGGSVYGT